MHAFYRNACLAGGVGLWLLITPVKLVAGPPWYVPYEKALDAQQEGRWSESVDYLRQAMKDRPEPKAKARTYGLHFINYLPYYYMGVAYISLGDTAAAKKNFALSKQKGEILDAPDEYQDLQNLMAVITGTAPVIVATKTEPPVAAEPAQTGKVIDDSAPWYVWYETGLEYVQSGDWSKAVDNLLRSVAMKKESEQYARTYGMWYISYLPYYYLGVSLYNQGLWDAAQERLQEEEANNVIQQFSDEYSRLQALLRSLKGKVTAATPSPKRQKDALNTKIVDAVRTFNEQEYDKAAAQFNEILMLDPYNSVAKSYLARIASLTEAPGDDFLAGAVEFSKKNFKGAVELLRSAARDEEGNPRIAAYLGAAYCELYLGSKKKDKQMLDNAHEEFERGLSLSSSFRLDPRVFSRDVIRLFNEYKKSRK